MNGMRRVMRIATVGLLLLAVQGLAWAGGAVIVSADSGVSQMSKAQVKSIFLGKKSTLPDGTPAVPVNLPEGDPLYSAFNKAVLGKSDAKMKKYWSARMFSGKGKPPKVAKDVQAVVAHVKSVAGGIGYVDEGAAGDGVKVVFRFQ